MDNDFAFNNDLGFKDLGNTLIEWIKRIHQLRPERNNGSSENESSNSAYRNHLSSGNRDTDHLKRNDF
jgi:hypothetical protein